MPLARSGYNPDNEELMLDEAQAFLRNTADERAFSARDIGMTGLELDALRSRFWRTLPADEPAGLVAAGVGRRFPRRCGPHRPQPLAHEEFPRRFTFRNGRAGARSTT